MKRETTPKLKARYVPISKVSVQIIRRMYEIYSQYYENISLDLFCQDMAEKNGVFLVEDRSTKRVVGFSTSLSFSLTNFKLFRTRFVQLRVSVLEGEKNL